MRQLASIHDIDVSPDNPWIADFKWVSYLIYDEMDTTLRNFFRDFWQDIHDISDVNLVIITADINPHKLKKKSRKQRQSEKHFKKTIRKKFDLKLSDMPFLVFCENIDSDNYYVFKFTNPDDPKLLRSAIRYICDGCEAANNFDHLEQQIKSSKNWEIVKIHAPGFISRNLISVVKLIASGAM